MMQGYHDFKTFINEESERDSDHKMQLINLIGNRKWQQKKDLFQATGFGSRMWRQKRDLFQTKEYLVVRTWS
jgi:hypothetical protein